MIVECTNYGTLHWISECLKVLQYFYMSVMADFTNNTSPFEKSNLKYNDNMDGILGTINNSNNNNDNNNIYVYKKSLLTKLLGFNVSKY